MDVGDIEGDEAKLLIPVHELVPLCGDKVCELGNARRGRENCQDRESDEDVRTREWSHNAPSPVSGDACVKGIPWCAANQVPYFAREKNYLPSDQEIPEYCRLYQNDKSYQKHRIGHDEQAKYPTFFAVLFSTLLVRMDVMR
jgi:hypothetical protein